VGCSCCYLLEWQEAELSTILFRGSESSIARLVAFKSWREFFPSDLTLDCKWGIAILVIGWSIWCMLGLAGAEVVVSVFCGASHIAFMRGAL
jgi:hypothetical protein